MSLTNSPSVETYKAYASRTLDSARELGPKIRGGGGRNRTRTATADAFGTRDAPDRHVPDGDAVVVGRSGAGFSYSDATVSLKTWEVAGRVLLGLEHNYGLLF